MFNDMLKDVIKQLIMLHQNNIPFSLKERDIMLPVPDFVNAPPKLRFVVR